MEVILLRHGRTAGNGEKRYIGRTDEPLCPEGAAEVRASGCFPDITKVCVSPMLRARQTAELLFPNARQIVADDMREMDFGSFEGRNAGEMEADTEYRAWVDGMCKDPCPGGEDLSAFSSRVCNAFRAILDEAVSSCDERLVIVAHGGTIMAIMERFAAPARPYHAWLAENCRGWRARLCMRGAEPVLADYGYMDELEL